MKKLLLLLTTITCACSSVSITGVHNANGFSIKNFKTFNFYDVDASGDGIGENYQNNLKLLKEAIEKQMKLKGISLSTSEPDLLVNIGIVISQEVQTRQTDFSNPADRTAYMGQRSYSWQSQTVVVGSYREGTVTLDLVDRVSNKLGWQGSAESVVPEKEKNIPALIEEGMAALFTKIK